MTAKDQLIGTWKLASLELRRPDGTAAYPFGRNVIGMLIYDAGGNMSVQILGSERSAFASDDPFKGAPEEIKSAFEGMILTYFGSYDVIEEEGAVIHHIKGSAFPNWAGFDLKRPFELSGNHLKLDIPSIMLGGEELTGRLIWERTAIPKITNFMRREIQAPIAARLIRAFAGVVGRDKALESAAEAIREDAASSGKKMAEKFGGNSMKELGRVLRELWAEDGALEFRILEENERTLNFDVTRCRYAELFEQMEMKELGVCLTCIRDEPFIAGFNPLILFMRTQTIMEGEKYCDFRFTML